MYYTNLAMMKGHLTVARELYQAGEQTAAQPHFGHPIHEHYGVLEPAFEARGVEGIESNLKALVETMRTGGEWESKTDAYATALEAIDEAMQDVDGELRDDVAFQSRAQLVLLRQALHEYEEAVDDGQFVNIVEYQDSRGFVLTAQALLEAQVDLYAEDTYAELLAAYESTLEAWPSAVAPETPVMTPGELSARLFKLEATLGRY
ncbi:hypothetical protein [Halomonas icarae]|uniref:Uncharacterized protein n=1 Tax=Halomonas icarae TaxID=2691040 RepID=A0A7X4W0I4_9GAMM|nr:hypothetical protein [Halomonas icarae]MDR5902584.1 hypothetical protein [Halomonas icarae]NAW12443.1 hypothetical protein [Halomonas icarae]